MNAHTYHELRRQGERVRDRKLDELREQLSLMQEEEREAASHAAADSAAKAAKDLQRAMSQMANHRAQAAVAGELAGVAADYLTAFLDSRNLEASLTQETQQHQVHSFSTTYSVNPALFNTNMLADLHASLTTEQGTLLQIHEVHYDDLTQTVTISGHHAGARGTELDLRDLVPQTIAHAEEQWDSSQGTSPWRSLTGRPVSLETEALVPAYLLKGYTLVKDPESSNYLLSVSGVISDGYSDLSDESTSLPVSFPSEKSALEALAKAYPSSMVGVQENTLESSLGSLGIGKRDARTYESNGMEY